MRVRLVKDAPWPMVTMPNGFIVEKNVFSESNDTNLLAIKQWLEEETPELLKEEEEKSSGKLNFYSMTKIDLILYCRTQGIDTEGLTKAQILEKLAEYESLSERSSDE